MTAGRFRPAVLLDWAMETRNQSHGKNALHAKEFGKPSENFYA